MAAPAASAQWVWEGLDGRARHFSHADACTMEECFVAMPRPATVTVSHGKVVDLTHMVMRWPDGKRSPVRRVSPDGPAAGHPTPCAPSDLAAPSIGQPTLAVPFQMTAADAEQAVRANDVPRLAQYIQGGGDPNATVPPGGCTLLYIACRGGRLGAARCLAEDAGADVNLASGAADSTPLHGACYGGHVEVVELLVRHGADTTKTNKHGHTPEHDARHYVCDTGSPERARLCLYLLQDGAKIHQVCGGVATAHPTPAQPCAMHPATHAAAVVEDSDGTGHDISDAFRQHIDKHPDDVELRLRYAAYLCDRLQDRVEAMQQLCSAILHDATGSRARVALAWLLVQGGRYNVAIRVAQVALHCAERAQDKSNTIMARDALLHAALLAAAESITQPDPGVDTALAAIQQFHDFGGDPNALVPTEDGRTLLYLAACSGHVDVVGHVLRCPTIHVNKRSGTPGMTALDAARAAGHDVVVRLLLRYQADTRTLTAAPLTPVGADVGESVPPPNSIEPPSPLRRFESAEAAASLEEVRVMAARGAEYRRWDVRGAQVRVAYVCPICPEHVTTAADLVAHAAGPCQCLGRTGEHVLLAGLDGHSALAVAACDLTVDKGHNTAALHNALCTVLSALVPLRGSDGVCPAVTTARCWLAHRSQPSDVPDPL